MKKSRKAKTYISIAVLAIWGVTIIILPWKIALIIMLVWIALNGFDLANKEITKQITQENKEKRKKILKGLTSDLTWPCEICNKERPDKKISVISYPVKLSKKFQATRNLKYCNDNKNCIKTAKKLAMKGLL
jgi:hypothetical protein